MTNDVDLTEKGYFNDYTFEERKKYKPYYRYPWEPGDGFFAKNRKYANSFNYNYYLSDTNLFGSPSTTSSNITTVSLKDFDGNHIRYYKNGDVINIIRSCNYCNEKQRKPSTFCDDKKPSIAYMRRISASDKTCYRCKKPIPVSEILFEMAVNSKELYHSYECDECKRKKRFNKAVENAARILYEPKKKATKFNVIDEYFDVYEPKQLNFKIHERSYISSIIRNPYNRKLNDRYALYYKGKVLNNREDMYQPMGRVPQEYDRIFDSINWRDMLRRRLGEIDTISKNDEPKKTEDSTNNRITFEAFQNISIANTITLNNFSVDYNNFDIVWDDSDNII